MTRNRIFHFYKHAGLIFSPSPSHREIIPIENVENVAARKGRVRYALGSKRSQTDLVSEIADPGVSALYAADTPTRFRPLNIPRHREFPVFFKKKKTEE